MQLDLSDRLHLFKAKRGVSSLHPVAERVRDDDLLVAAQANVEQRQTEHPAKSVVDREPATDVRHDVLREPRVRDHGQNPILQLVPDGPATTQQRRYFGVLERLLYVDVSKYNPPPLLAFPAATYLNLDGVGTTVRSILRRALAAAVGADVGRPAMLVKRGSLGRQINKFLLAPDVLPEGC